MSELAGLAGPWVGVNRLRLMPDDPYAESDAQATVTVSAQGAAVALAYTWADAGAPQDGLLVLSDDEAPGAVAAVWVDSWHQRPQWMPCRGTVDQSVVVEGSYGPDLRWRITLDPGDGTRLRMTMDNVMPDADYQAVEAVYTRVPTPPSPVGRTPAA